MDLSIPQAVMAFVDLPKIDSGQELYIPAWATAISASILFLHFVLALKPVDGFLSRVGILEESSEKVPPPGIGKGTILAFRVARLLGCLGLFTLSVFPFRHEGLVRRILLSTPYLYASVLASFSVSPKNTHHRLIRHANCVMFLAFCVYVYRDLVPLTTFTGVPADVDEGRGLWVKFAILFVIAVVVPLFTPRQYIPVDPLNPQTVLSPEQTASIFSVAFYFFLDHIIFLAYRESQLQEDELYPLCDTDTSTYLKNRSFKYLDSFSGSKSQRHIFFGLMRVFHREFTILAGLLVVRVLTNYSGPFAMNKLLQYIEMQDQGVDVTVRPWVWIGLILLGPIVGSVAFQIYIFINTRSLVRTEAIITQLVFAHRQVQPLRIRMKAETTAAKDAEGDVPAVDGPPPAPRAGSDAGSTDETVTMENGEGSPRSEDDSATVQASSSSIKSTASKQPPKPTKQEGSLVGKINNLVTTDLGNIVDSRDFLVLVIYIPLQIAIGIWFLYVLLGWSVWVGVASIILLAPLPGYMAKLVQSVQKERLKLTDERVQSVSEAVNVLRMIKIKLFGWEGKMKDRIGDKRDSELIWIRKRRIIDLFSNLVNFIIPVITMTVTYATYVGTLIMGQPLNASKVFSSMVVFDLLRDNIAQITGWLNNLMTGKVSIYVFSQLDRVNDFLRKTELLDTFDEKETSVFLSAAAPSADERIGFHNATFSWSRESDGSLTRSQRQFQLKIDGEVLFERGRINLIVGPTGSGKTSLLMALLGRSSFFCNSGSVETIVPQGEMHFIPSSPDSWYNLPRSSGVAYAAQESWVLNETIRSNIVFDTPFDEERYKKVLYQCALEPDLVLFQAGDQTEVGEKGLTLSGGQKARLTLARAVYSKASILLLDDVLAALDVHTAQWIVEKCLGGDLIGMWLSENRTVVLVTHNVALTRPIADFVVTFGSDGRIQSQGTMSEIAKRGPLAAQIHKDQQALDKTQQEVDAENPPASVAKPADGKLIVAEEVQLGHVSASALKMYFIAMGGKHPLFFFVFFFSGLFFQQIFVALRTWQLGYWAKQYDVHPADEVDVVFYLSTFVAIVFISSLALTIVFIYLVFGQLRASRVIHKNLIDSVLTAPLRWLDVTPTSRIIARVTNDVRAVDDSLANQFWPLAAMIVSMLVKFAAVVIYTPIFFFPGALVGALGAWVGQIYIAGQLPVKRLMSNTRAPVLAHFGAAIAGLVSIRAFGAQTKFSTESLSRIDRYTRAARNYYNLNRWVSVRVDILGAMFAAGLATYLVYIQHARAGDAGFVINMAITFTQMLLWAVRVTNEFEVQGNSLERIQGYINIEHEKPATETGKPPAYWPASGDLQVEGLSARYSEDGPKVLQDISFHIKSGERVGIVGRTGSGKSSLTLSLLRCIPTEGSVKYDGLETSELNLDALRSSITIIPQVPELLSGTLRANLDPFGQYDDVELNYALRAAGLFALQNEMDEGRITLDSAISTGGTNLSVGQRQIFALARAIVRKSKILILDEATSAIDYKTDSIIQNSLRQELRGDVSLITVAHRLQTIMDADKIMVLDAGRIAEFDSPKELLKIKEGKLRALVEESGDREALYSMAGAE
ncbi:Multidrug resistance-associated ABC transporter protein [Mycena venus]|uniref:Multidrug resistance-associated ABC transporter protein n=1 Tax=Mycena venus TaxID=2733690 RepID=A0A8H6YTJ6_9AGAR|nr:Multidrug resistance-associated ABC transporter protein [Mycena venus]